MRLASLAVSCTMAVALGLLPAIAWAQLDAKFGPRGEVTRLSAGGVVYLQDIAVSLIKPGWSGRLADQGAVDPRSVKVEKQNDSTVYTATLSAPGGTIRLREIARVAPRKITLEYEITPEQDVETEVVLLQGTMPADVHAGKTRYVVVGDDLARGVCPAELNRDGYVVFGGRSADWVGFTRRGEPALRVTSGAASLQLQDDRKWNVPGFALLAMAGGGRLPAGKTIRFSISYAADYAQQMQADARRRGQDSLEGLKLADARPLELHNVTLGATTVATYSPVELTADIAASYDNPFDPDQIAVDAEVIAPDGNAVTVPGFLDVPMRLETTRGGEHLVPAGTPGFRVRYAPAVAGKHRLVLKVTDRSGTVRSAPLELTATAGPSLGFVRVSAQSPRYFAHDNGRPFFAIGENVCWSGNRTPVADYAAWLKELGAAGGNWARLWLAYNEKGLEWMPAPTAKPGTGTYLGLGRYSPGNSWRLDEVVRLARENGVYLMFCLGTYGEFTEGGYFNEGCWVSNPYNAKNGGPCARPADFWTSPEAKKLYRKRLRYLIARWGYSPNVFAWEFWNEVPATPAASAWVAEMAAYLKGHDPNRHLVSTTYGDAATWNCPDVDFTMTHMYGQAGNTADFTPRIEGEAHAALRHDKPYLLAEFGIDWQTGDERWDRKRSGLNMHNGAWAAMMSGAAGTAMLWYWDSYVHPSHLYHILTPVRKFTDTVDWSKTSFRPISGLRVMQGRDQAETFTDLLIPATTEWGRSPSNSYSVGHDGAVQGGPVAMTVGSPGRGNPRELYTQLTWHIDLPEPGRIIARLGQVCSGARLRITVDNQVRLDRVLAAGGPGKGPWKSARHLDQWNVWVSDYDEEIAIEVPAGRHDVTFANIEGDWLQIRSLILPRYRSSRYPAVDALGLASARELLLWFHNHESTWRTEHDGKTPARLHALQARVPAPDGAWQVEWWNTSTGNVVRRDPATAARGELVLTIPDFSSDMAARVDFLTAGAH